jgi:DNA-binding response OmpR family regulator
MEKILIVEDNPDLLLILDQLLSTEYEVITTRRGEDAVVLARQIEPDVVILDLHLPNMDGVETGTWIKRERAPDVVPILVLTAMAGPGDAEAILATGCCDMYLAKPAPLDVIRERVHELLRGASRSTA